jgi:uncharacterized protein YbjT (DUF2867 family)
MAGDKEHTAFVAGATGYVGRSVVAELRRAGIRTVAHVRPDSSRLGAWRDHFEALGAEFDSTRWHQSAMTARLTALRPTLVFALLGTTRHRMRRSSDRAANSYETVDYGLSALLLRAAAAADRGPRFVYLSAAGVSERSRGAYMKVRWRLESELRATPGVRWTIARPAFISGPDRDEARPAERIAVVASDTVLSLLGRKARRRWASLTGDELARGLVRLALDPAASGHIAQPADLRDPTR